LQIASTLGTSMPSAGGVHLIIDGETISGSPLSRDNWFAIQRIQFDRRVSFGIGSGRNQFWLYRNAEGANLVVLAARECHLGTLYRPDQARSA
jgi:hypothetical protein